MHYKYLFNRDLFNEYVKEAKIKFEDVTERFGTEKNSMDIEGIYELLTLYNKNLMNEIDELLCKRMNEINLDVTSKFDAIKKNRTFR